MADYKKIVSIIKSKNKGFSWRIDNIENPPCETGFSDTILGKKQNNTSYGISWYEFNYYAKELGYEPTCENFKEMPDTIYNVIFKKVYWDSIQGDKIKNQGVANALVENHGLGIAYIFDKLKKLGYVRPYSNSGTISENLTNSFRLTDSDVDFINKIENEGKSNLLFDELKTEKDKVYLASKISVLTTSEKIGIGAGVLFLMYLSYKLLKR